MTPRPGNCHAGLNGGLAVLEHYGDPRALLAAGLGELTQMIATVSHHQQGTRPARQWRDAAAAAVELYDGHPAVPFTELAARAPALFIRSLVWDRPAGWARPRGGPDPLCSPARPQAVDQPAANRPFSAFGISFAAA